MNATVETYPSILEFLKHLSLFSGLSDDDLEKLMSMGRELDLQPGDILIREGDEGDSLFIIITGEFEITKNTEQGEVVIAHRGVGEVIGEMSLLDNAPRSATVRAIKPTHLFEINQESFHSLLAWSPAAVKAILRTVTSRLRNTEAMLQQREKMAALGTLAAGVAHELNNPAAAARRASAQLREELLQVERLEFELSALPLDPDQRAKFNEWRAQVDGNAAAAKLDPLTRADLESELQDWLEEHGIDEAWEIAPRLVASGFDRVRLDEVAELFEVGQVRLVLTWLAARGNVISLLDEVASSAERISTIVKAIKSYSYLDQAPVQEVDLHEGLDNTLVILRYKLKTGVNVVREYARNLPKVEAYASELNQVWTNIIDNAIDAMKGQGHLTLRTRAEGDRVVVEICDNGPGIPADIQERIFEPFFTTKGPGHGTGLGLHISYNIIVLKHQGQISVSSRSGATCFNITLPVRMSKRS